jgi:uncharacterized glyoxalase superfamily protein PhnB
MARTPPEGNQRIIPYLYYDDAPAALDFLAEAFGFRETLRVARPDGGVMHAETGYQGNVVMLGTPPDGAARRGLPVRHGSVMCWVDDVDAHHARARAAGAEIVAPLEDKPYGDRMYTAADPEGHQWHFATSLRDEAPGS